MNGDRTVYELGNGIEIHVTRDGRVLHIIDDHPPDEMDITNTSLGQLLLKGDGRFPNLAQPLSTLKH